MSSNLYPTSAADLLRLVAGTWVEIRRGPHNQIYALISKYRRHPPVAYRSGRFVFRAHGLGYGTGETRLLAKYEPVTLPLNE